MLFKIIAVILVSSALLGAFLLSLNYFFYKRNNGADQKNILEGLMFMRGGVRPDYAILDQAISKAKSFYVDEYLKNSLATVKNNQVTVLFAKDGKTTQVSESYKPKEGEEVKTFKNTYAEYQLYIVVHFLMYFKDWGYSLDDPLVQEAKNWLVGTMDAKEGKWLWSSQGCLQPKAIIALARVGETEKAKKAMEWALKSPLKTKDGFLEFQNGLIIHSFAAPEGSLSGKDFISEVVSEGGQKPSVKMNLSVSTQPGKDFVPEIKLDGVPLGEKIPEDVSLASAEQSAKFLYAMAILKMDDTNDFKELKGKLLGHLKKTNLKTFTSTFSEATAVSWIIFTYEDNNLVKDDLYNEAKKIVIAVAADDLKNNSLQNYARGKVLNALSLIKDGNLDEIKVGLLNKIIKEQFASGGWDFTGSMTVKSDSGRGGSAWYESKKYEKGFILNHLGGQGSTTKTILEALMTFKKSGA